ncbi:MAG: hypothetical protein ACI90V_013242, partial [Bacillariaceae sp.]
VNNNLKIKNTKGGFLISPTAQQQEKNHELFLYDP